MRIRMGPTNDLNALVEDTLVFETTQWELEGVDGRLTTFVGELLGLGSSKRDEHNHPINSPQQELVNRIHRGDRCAACRWSEFYLFRVKSGDGPRNGVYAVYTLGPSVVDGETTRMALQWAMSAFEIVELAMVRRGDRGAPYMPMCNARAIAMAADVDERIANAYVNRAVA